MDHGRDLPGQGVSPHQLVKAVAVQIVHIAAFDQIAPFLAAGQIVHHHDFVQIHAVQLPEQALPIKPAPPVITYIRASVRHASPKPARAASGPPRRVILFSVRCFIPPSGHYGFCFVRAAQCHPLTVVEKGMFSRRTLTRGDFGAQQAKRARRGTPRQRVATITRGQGLRASRCRASGLLEPFTAKPCYGSRQHRYG